MGKAIIINDILFSQHLGILTSNENDDSNVINITSLTINGNNEINNSDNSSVYSVSYTPTNTTQRGVVWSIISGSSYASIDQNGILSINSNANNSTVKIKATSLYNESIYATKEISVTYLPSQSEPDDGPTQTRPVAIRSKVRLNTNIPITNVTRIEGKILCPVGYKTMIGWEQLRSNHATRLLAYANNKVLDSTIHLITLRWGTNTYNFVDPSEPIEYVQYNNHCECNGESYSYGSSASVQSTTNLELFLTSLEPAQNVDQIDGTIYYVRLYNNDTLIHELLPYKDSDTNYGFEDTVTGTKYNVYSAEKTFVIEND